SPSRSTRRSWWREPRRCCGVRGQSRTSRGWYAPASSRGTASGTRCAMARTGSSCDRRSSTCWRSWRGTPVVSSSAASCSTWCGGTTFPVTHARSTSMSSRCAKSLRPRRSPTPASRRSGASATGWSWRGSDPAASPSSRRRGHRRRQPPPRRRAHLGLRPRPGVSEHTGPARPAGPIRCGGGQASGMFRPADSCRAARWRGMPAGHRHRLQRSSQHGRRPRPWRQPPAAPRLGATRGLRLRRLAVSRMRPRPLTQLAPAAEDMAAGNCARRVGIKGQDELGLLGSAFNRMAEAVERARTAQRDFLANVSHALKTPLTSLIGFSQALVDGSLLSDVERTRAASIVHEESERVLRMAQELLDLARVEAGSISMHITAVDLRGQLEQELEMVRPRGSARRLTLELNAPDDIPPVAADPERLHQVLDNLLDNAVKYAPEGAIVNAVARLGGGSVEAVVSNAVGSHRPDPDRMFDRFYRADPSRSAAAGGVGLGLAI